MELQKLDLEEAEWKRGFTKAIFGKHSHRSPPGPGIKGSYFHLAVFRYTGLGRKRLDFT